MHIILMVNVKILIRHLLISQEIFYWNQVKRKNFGVLPISMPYGSPGELRIYCVVILLTSYRMEQELHTNISKYGVRESKSSMDAIQEISSMIYPIGVISWYTHLLKELFSTRNHIKLLLYTEYIMIGFMNIMLAYP